MPRRRGLAVLRVVLLPVDLPAHPVLLAVDARLLRRGELPTVGGAVAGGLVLDPALLALQLGGLLGGALAALLLLGGFVLRSPPSAIRSCYRTSRRSTSAPNASDDRAPAISTAFHAVFIVLSWGGAQRQCRALDEEFEPGPARQSCGRHLGSAPTWVRRSSTSRQ